MNDSVEDPDVHSDGEPEGGPTTRSPRRTNPWIVPLVLLVGLIVAVTLIVTGRSEPSTAPDATTTTPAPASTTVTDTSPLPWLGSFADEDALRVQISGLDRRTLRPPPTATDPATSTAPASSLPPRPADAPTAADAQRCARGITMISTDPLGAPLAAAGAELHATPVLVATYEVPAAADHGPSVRAFLVEVASCRVLGAIEFAS